MTPNDNWRFDLAHRIAGAYADLPNAHVVMIAGSVGRGRDDAYSDIEIDVYYERAPTEDERIAVVQASGAQFAGLDEDEDEWEEQMRFDGFKAHSSTFLASTMERYLHQVVDLAEIAPAAQTRLYSLQQAIPVKGHAQIEEWRERAANYPDRLTHAMLEANLAFGGFWYGAEMFAARDDQLQLYDIFIDTAQQLLGALYGLNRLYLPTPDHLKWMDEMIGEMSIRPDNLSARLKHVFHVEPVVGVADLRELIVETLVLVEEHTADFDLTPYRPSAQDSRTRWDQPPRRLD